MDETAEARAQKRRTSWAGGVARSDDAARADHAFWQAATPEARVEAAWAMAAEAHALEGHDGPLPRLQRSLGGVRRG